MPPVAGRLIGEEVGIVAVRGVDEAAVKRAAAAARVRRRQRDRRPVDRGEVGARERRRATTLAEALGSSSKRPAAVRTTAWQSWRRG